MSDSVVGWLGQVVSGEVPPPGTLLVTPEELAGLLDRPTGSDNSDLQQVCEAADLVVRRYIDPALLPEAEQAAACREAAGAVAVQIWTTRRSPGGQTVAIDYQTITTPNLLGPGLMARVMGLLSPYRKYGGLVVG